MAVPNEVRIQIRHNVLMLKSFTIPQLERLTEINRQSIHTEIRRMEEDGYIIRTGTNKQRIDTRGGRPSIQFTLTADIDKKRKLLDSTRAFTFEVDSINVLRKPESKYYYLAIDLFEDSISQLDDLSVEDKEYQLEEIIRNLDYARIEENIGRKANQTIENSIDLLLIKAKVALSLVIDPAIQDLYALEERFKSDRSDALVKDIHEYIVLISNKYLSMLNRYQKTVENSRVKYCADVIGIIHNYFSRLEQIRTHYEVTDTIISTLFNFDQRLSLVETKVNRIIQQQQQSDIEQTTPIRSDLYSGLLNQKRGIRQYEYSDVEINTQKSMNRIIN